MSAKRRILFLAAGAVFVAAMAAAVIAHVRSNPDIVFLRDADAAHWITYPDAPSLIGYEKGLQFAVFRTTITVDAAHDSDATLIYRALRVADVYVNDVALAAADRGPEHWKTARELNIGGHLQPGENIVQLNVANDSGPAALLATVPELGIASDANWMCTRDGQQWVNARLASNFPPIPLSREFPDAAVAFSKTLPVSLALFAFVMFLSLYSGADGRWARTRERMFSPSNVRWALIAGVGVLGVNNVLRLEHYVGMDSVYHSEYIRFLLDHGRLPLADDGPQMFRSPLPYVLYALLHVFFSGFLDSEVVDKAVRLLSVACSVAMIEICYRTMRHAFPGRAGVQCVGIIVGGLLPTMLTTSQVVGDEPLTGALGGCALLLGIRILAAPSNATWKTFGVFGGVLGLALLCKFTSLLLIPPALGVVALWSMSPWEGWRKPVTAFCAFAVACTVISGWFFARNYYHFGQFLIGGWDPLIGSNWWQDPGYRTTSYFTRFGDVFRYPVFSMMTSFWDGLYGQIWMDAALSGVPSVRKAPPWNYPMMLASGWWAVVPAAALLIGVARAGWSVLSSRAATPMDPLLVFCAGVLAMYLGAIVYHTIEVPYYSSTKATYLIAATPAIGLLAAAGCAPAMQNARLRAPVCAGVVCWAATVYTAYFVIH